MTFWAGKVTTEAKGGLGSWQCWEVLQRPGSLGSETPPPRAPAVPDRKWRSGARSIPSVLLGPLCRPFRPTTRTHTHAHTCTAAHTHTHTHTRRTGRKLPLSRADKAVACRQCGLGRASTFLDRPPRILSSHSGCLQSPGLLSAPWGGGGGLQGRRRAPRRQARGPAAPAPRRPDPGGRVLTGGAQSRGLARDPAQWQALPLPGLAWDRTATRGPGPALLSASPSPLALTLRPFGATAALGLRAAGVRRRGRRTGPRMVALEGRCSDGDGDGVRRQEVAWGQRQRKEGSLCPEVVATCTGTHAVR